MSKERAFVVKWSRDFIVYFRGYKFVAWFWVSKVEDIPPVEVRDDK
jgi:hypothetical protein